MIPEIEREYSANRPYVSHLSLEQKLRTFANVVTFAFSIASTTMTASDIDVPRRKDIVITIAGFDADGSLKVGQVDLIPKPLHTGIAYCTFQADNADG